MNNNNSNNNDNNNNNSNKNQIISLKKCYLRLCLTLICMKYFFNFTA